MSEKHLATRAAAVEDEQVVGEGDAIHISKLNRLLLELPWVVTRVVYNRTANAHKSIAFSTC